MELNTEIKTKNCDMDCDCKDCEMQRENDDQNILVSVSPRRFSLPTAREEKTKMEIKNQNPYPIYFKTNTSNMDAFRLQPDCGCIAPNSKVSVDVQFNNSARPLRRHEEVIVFTSVKPFKQFALYEKQICPYCMEPFGFSNHSHKQIHKENYCADQEHQRCQKNKMHTKRSAKYYPDLKSSEDEQFAQNNATHKHRIKTEYYKNNSKPESMQPGKSKDIKKTQEEMFDNDYSRQNEKNQSKHYAYKRFWKLPTWKIYSDENVNSEEKCSGETIGNRRIFCDEEVYDKREYFREDNKEDYSARKTKHKHESHKLKEICIHAFVHRPSAGICECGNCVELGFDKEDEKKLGRYVISNEHDDVKRMKNVEHVPESRYKTDKEVHLECETKDATDDKTGTDKIAHILTRIFRVEDDKASNGTSDSTELNSMDVEILAKRAKIMTEEDYKKKKEKFYKKLKKICKEESETNSTTDVPENGDPKTGKICNWMKRRSTLAILEKKSSTILRLSWFTMLLLIVLLLVMFGCFYFHVSGNQGKKYMFPCFYNFYLQDFE